MIGFFLIIDKHLYYDNKLTHHEGCYIGAEYGEAERDAGDNAENFEF